MASDVSPDPAPVRRAIEGAFPELRVASAVFLGEGWDSSAWEINGRLVFRFPKREEVAGWLMKEAGLLPALAPALPVPVPQFSHLARSGAPADPALPFVGYPALRGVFLDQAPELLAPTSPLIPQLGAFLAALHAFPVDEAVDCGVPPGTWGTWLAWWREFVARILDQGSAHLDLPTYAWAITLLGDFLAELGLDERTVTLVHHDLALEHILTTPEGTALTGVIDWGDAAIGDPALDFAGFIAGGCPPATVATLLAAYGGQRDGRFLHRAAWYARLGPFHLLHFGLHLGDPAMIAQGVAAVAEMRAR
jgi:aminoglycoside phosphotransferase (APT) family kinase protein